MGSGNGIHGRDFTKGYGGVESWEWLEDREIGSKIQKFVRDYRWDGESRGRRDGYHCIREEESAKALMKFRKR